MYKTLLFVVIFLMVVQIAILIVVRFRYGWDSAGMATFRSSSLGRVFYGLRNATFIAAGATVIVMLLGL